MSRTYLTPARFNHLGILNRLLTVVEHSDLARDGDRQAFVQGANQARNEIPILHKKRAVVALAGDALGAPTDAQMAMCLPVVYDETTARDIDGNEQSLCETTLWKRGETWTLL